MDKPLRLQEEQRSPYSPLSQSMPSPVTQQVAPLLRAGVTPRPIPVHTLPHTEVCEVFPPQGTPPQGTPPQGTPPQGTLHTVLASQGQIKHALDIITNLQFISSLSPGDKFYTSTRSICKPSFYNRVIRTLSGESRELEYIYINRHVTDAIAFIDTFDRDNPILQSYVNDMLKILETTIHGINSIIQTYEVDKIFCIRLGTIIDVIEKSLERYTKNSNSILS